MWERRFKIQRGEEVSGQGDLREEAQDAMLGVAKNENDSCGIQNLIVKRICSWRVGVLMAPRKQ